MSAAAISREQIRAIHTLKGRAGLDDAAYRDMLAGAGVATSLALTRADAIAMIDRLRELAGEPRAAAVAPGRSGALALSGPYVPICRALWISAWNLGVIEAREDTALVAFVRRQTGIEHLNWVRDHPDGQKVVEALKAWLAREAGVRWPKRARGTGAAVDLRKLAVIEAQQRLLGDTGRVPDDADLDRLMTEFGRRVRALARAEGRK